MKVLIVSDIHGSLAAAEKVQELQKDCSWILCLGDILYHGPRNDLPASYKPKGVIPIMNSLKDKIVAVRGNCEAEVDQMVLEFSVMSTTAVFAVNGYTFHLSHGHIYNEENPVPGAKIFLYGHTHIPVAHTENGITFFNPGSMSIPKGGFPASYGLYEDGLLSVKALENNETIMSIRL